MHFTASSTQAGVTVTTNGAAITVSAPRNEGDTYKRYTIDVAFSLEAPDGTKTMCNDKGQTLYVVVDYK